MRAGGYEWDFRERNTTSEYLPKSSREALSRSSSTNGGPAFSDATIGLPMGDNSLANCLNWEFKNSVNSDSVAQNNAYFLHFPHQQPRRMFRGQSDNTLL